MNNSDVSNLLTTIADLMDIKGENFFKIRAYHLAAQAIHDSPEDISILVKERRLKDLAGVGDAIAKKIAEYVKTGRLSYLEKLTEEIPLNILSLLQIPGLGPKKVATLHRVLHIDTIESLKQACKEGKLRDLDGFGEITERNILRGIQLLERTSGRSLLHHAYNNGQHFLQYIKKCSGVIQVDLAGSLRRMKETIGDIDIIVASEDPDTVMDHFIKYPKIKQILVQGKTKTSVLLIDSIQVDLRVVPIQSYGAALQYFTGSKEHNVTLRGLAVRQGFKLNEYGLFEKKTDKYLSGRTEQDIYTHLNLQFIPPEIRENRGEIEAAKTKTLPRLLEIKDVKGDLHIHSTYSDGSNSISDMVEACVQKSYEYVGITDHSQSLKIARGLDGEAIQAKKEEIKRLNETAPLHVFCGTECDIKSDGTLDYPNDVLGLFDYVGIGIHTGFNMTKDEATERIIQGMKHPSVTFLAHPTCRMIGHREGFDLDMDQIFETAVDANTALEINSFPDRLDLNDIQVKRGKELGVRFIIGTDAHAKEHLEYMKFGVATARRGWLEKEDVINTVDLTTIEEFFKKGRKENG